mmetsp:Transcript_33/g.106  ORF Transcript_33/g.106 Transcript_33/m.106 type:complete len:279 (+) Transcript_33:1333-2169(+)
MDDGDREFSNKNRQTVPLTPEGFRIKSLFYHLTARQYCPVSLSVLPTAGKEETLFDLQKTRGALWNGRKRSKQERGEEQDRTDVVHAHTLSLSHTRQKEKQHKIKEETLQRCLQKDAAGIRTSRTPIVHQSLTQARTHTNIQGSCTRFASRLWKEKQRTKIEKAGVSLRGASSSKLCCQAVPSLFLLPSLVFLDFTPSFHFFGFPFRFPEKKQTRNELACTAFSERSCRRRRGKRRSNSLFAERRGGREKQRKKFCCLALYYHPSRGSFHFSFSHATD